MKKILVIIVLLLAVTLSVFSTFQFSQPKGKFSENVSRVIHAFGSINSISEIKVLFTENEILHIASNDEDLITQELPSIIAKDEILLATNKERENENLSVLIENKQLALSAQWKVIDMFEHQYFEHMGPTGKGVAELVTEAGYAYVSVAENLALGNFTSAEEVVEAWMNSEGHRANILNNEFTEIGIGIAKGEFEGTSVWLVVQHFGRPLNLCPVVDMGLKATIDTNELQIDAIVKELDDMYKVIETLEQDSDEYKESTKLYNTLVGEYGVLVNETQDFIDTYNKQVQLFNACVS